MFKNGIIKIDKLGYADVRVDLIPLFNTTSRPQFTMQPKYITIHNTGNKKADAIANSEYVDITEKYVSWHFTVDDKIIIQELPINEVAWHAGDGNKGAGNRHSISIEICEHKGIDYLKAEENAIQLIILLMKELELSIDKVVPHQKWSGKYCPHIILDYGWDKFIERIKKAYYKKYNLSQWAFEAKEWVIKEGISDGTRPKDLLTREEQWTMLYRALRNK